MTNPTYLDQARAEDWGHEAHRDGRNATCSFCGESYHDGALMLAHDYVLAWRSQMCPVRIARFALERVIEEIERLAKERCGYCRTMIPFDPPHPTYGVVHRVSKYGIEKCMALAEQRRLAQLKAELESFQLSIESS